MHQKAIWSISYVVSVVFFPNLKQNFIAYRSSKVSLRPDCIFEIHQLWQSGFNSVYSNSCCSCSFEAEIIKISQSYHKMYSNNILNFQECTTILNAKKSENLLNAPRIYMGGVINNLVRQFTFGHCYVLYFAFHTIWVCAKKKECIWLYTDTQISICAYIFLQSFFDFDDNCTSNLLLAFMLLHRE